MATKTTTMTLRVSPTFKRLLDNAARREQRSRTNFLEKLVADYCQSVGVATSEHDQLQATAGETANREES